MVSIRLPGASAPVRPLRTIVRGAGGSGKPPREYRLLPIAIQVPDGDAGRRPVSLTWQRPRATLRTWLRSPSRAVWVSGAPVDGERRRGSSARLPTRVAAPADPPGPRLSPWSSARSRAPSRPTRSLPRVPDPRSRPLHRSPRPALRRRRVRRGPGGRVPGRPAVARRARRSQPARLGRLRHPPVPAGARLAARPIGAPSRPDGARARVPAPLRPGPRGHVPRAGDARLPRGRAGRRLAADRRRLPASRSCSRPRASASAAGSTSCAGGFRRSSRGCSGARIASSRSRCRRSTACADRVPRSAVAADVAQAAIGALGVPDRTDPALRDRESRDRPTGPRARAPRGAPGRPGSPRSVRRRPPARRPSRRSAGRPRRPAACRAWRPASSGPACGAAR